MLLQMHWSARRGYLEHPTGKPYTDDDIGRMAGIESEEVGKILSEMEDRYGVFSRDENGVIFNRRMVRDSEISAKRREAGMKRRPLFVGTFAEQNGDFAEQNREQNGNFAEQNGNFAEQNRDFAEQNREQKQPGGNFAEQNGDFAEQNGDFAEQNGDFAEQNREQNAPAGNFAEQNGDFAEQNPSKSAPRAVRRTRILTPIFFFYSYSSKI